MIGNTYWTTGITLRADNDGKWAAYLQFFDSGFCDQKSTEGKLTTRYYCDDLMQAIDTLVADATKLGIQFGTEAAPATIYYECDGEDPDCPPPANWRQIVSEQCDRLGWQDLYRELDEFRKSNAT